MLYNFSVFSLKCKKGGCYEVSRKVVDAVSSRQINNRLTLTKGASHGMGLN